MSPRWSAGYVSDVAYTLGFYREMSPVHLDYICAIHGYAAPRIGDSLSYCELGCGRGFGTAILAAANPDARFVGVDFNPAHIAEAREFAAQAGLTNVDFVEADFRTVADSNEGLFKSFDMVAAHGVYSWVSAEVRESIHEFVRRKLAPGGLLYVSYNSYPGWASSAPVQHLLRQYADRAIGDSLARVAAGRNALVELDKKKSQFTAVSPSAKRRIELLATQDPAYVAHEYLNENWQPLYVTEAIDAFREAKLSYIGSATIGENRLSMAIPAELIPVVQSAPDLVLRELLKDFAVNKQFRRDVYIKGPTKLTDRDALERLGQVTFALTAAPGDLPKTWSVPSGKATIKAAMLDAIVSSLEEGPKSHAALSAAVEQRKLNPAEIAPLLEVLVHNNFVNPCRADFDGLDLRPSQRLNQLVLDRSMASDSHRFLASPLLGSGVAANFFDRMAASVSLGNGKTSDKEVAEGIFDRFEQSRRRFLRDGKPVERSPESVENLAGLVTAFRTGSLPLWRKLGIASDHTGGQGAGSRGG